MNSKDAQYSLSPLAAIQKVYDAVFPYLFIVYKKSQRPKGTLISKQSKGKSQNFINQIYKFIKDTYLSHHVHQQCSSFSEIKNKIFEFIKIIQKQNNFAKSRFNKTKVDTICQRTLIICSLVDNEPQISHNFNTQINKRIHAQQNVRYKVVYLYFTAQNQDYTSSLQNQLKQYLCKKQESSSLFKMIINNCSHQYNIIWKCKQMMACSKIVRQFNSTTDGKWNYMQYISKQQFPMQKYENIQHNEIGLNTRKIYEQAASFLHILEYQIYNIGTSIQKLKNSQQYKQSTKMMQYLLKMLDPLQKNIQVNINTIVNNKKIWNLIIRMMSKSNQILGYPYLKAIIWQINSIKLNKNTNVCSYKTLYCQMPSIHIQKFKKNTKLVTDSYILVSNNDARQQSQILIMCNVFMNKNIVQLENKDDKYSKFIVQPFTIIQVQQVNENKNYVVIKLLNSIYDQQFKETILSIKQTPFNGINEQFVKNSKKLKQFLPQLQPGDRIPSNKMYKINRQYYTQLDQQQQIRCQDCLYSQAYYYFNKQKYYVCLRYIKLLVYFQQQVPNKNYSIFKQKQEQVQAQATNQIKIYYKSVELLAQCHGKIGHWHLILQTIRNCMLYHIDWRNEFQTWLQNKQMQLISKQFQSFLSHDLKLYKIYIRALVNCGGVAQAQQKIEPLLRIFKQYQQQNQSQQQFNFLIFQQFNQFLKLQCQAFHAKIKANIGNMITQDQRNIINNHYNLIVEDIEYHLNHHPQKTNKNYGSVQLNLMISHLFDLHISFQKFDIASQTYRECVNRFQSQPASARLLIQCKLKYIRMLAKTKSKDYQKLCIQAYYQIRLVYNKYADYIQETKDMSNLSKHRQSRWICASLQQMNKQFCLFLYQMHMFQQCMQVYSDYVQECQNVDVDLFQFMGIPYKSKI